MGRRTDSGRGGNPFTAWDLQDKALLAGVFCLLVAVAALVFLAARGGPAGGGKRSFTIGPRCGPLPASSQIEDQIKDEGACRNQCRAACAAESLPYAESSLRIDSGTGCNICDCSCG